MSATIVIFGASGDLTSRKLVPALYELTRKSPLPAQTRVVGFSRTPFSDKQWRDMLAKTTAERYRELIAKNAVSQQDTDTAVMQLEARDTQVASAQASAGRGDGMARSQREVDLGVPLSGQTARDVVHDLCDYFRPCFGGSVVAFAAFGSAFDGQKLFFHHTAQCHGDG